MGEKETKQIYERFNSGGKHTDEKTRRVLKALTALRHCEAICFSSAIFWSSVNVAEYSAICVKILIASCSRIVERTAGEYDRFSNADSDASWDEFASQL